MQGFVLELSHVKLILNYGASCEVDWIGWTDNNNVIAELHTKNNTKKLKKKRAIFRIKEDGFLGELYMWQAEKMK